MGILILFRDDVLEVDNNLQLENQCNISFTIKVCLLQ